MADHSNPVLHHSRREALIIFGAWFVATSYCCCSYYLFGMTHSDRPMGVDDLNLILGMPSWFVWGVLTPWVLCVIFTTWFAAFLMVDDDLGCERVESPDPTIKNGVGLE